MSEKEADSNACVTVIACSIFATKLVKYRADDRLYLRSERDRIVRLTQCLQINRFYIIFVLFQR